MNDTKPKCAELVMRCDKCRRAWVDHYPLPMRIGAFIARLNAACHCIHCGYRPRKRAKQQIVLLTGEAAEAAKREIGGAA